MVIFINQIRMKIGVMFGSPETTTGGNALKFYASVRWTSAAPERSRRATRSIGNETKVKVVKNKVAPPFKLAYFEILYGEGDLARRRDHRAGRAARHDRKVRGLVQLQRRSNLTPKAEIEGDMGDSHVGLQARLMSQALRKLTANIKRSNCVVIFINQIRMKIGVMFGSPETTTGGNALKFYASVRLDIRRTGSIKKGEEVIGNETKVKVVKNKVAPPFKLAYFEILYGEGVSREGEIIELGVQHGIIEKSGAWYSYHGDRIGQGRENVRQFLRDNPDLAAVIEAQIRALMSTLR